MTEKKHPQALEVRGAAISSIELASVARGIVVLDQMAKRAENAIVAARTLSPGRYLVVLSGNVAEIEESTAAAVATAKEELVDHAIIRDPAQGLVDGLAVRLTGELEESIAIVETATVSSALIAVDRTLKGAEVRLLELRLGAGLSGKGVFTLTGSLHMIEAARDIVRVSLAQDRVIGVEVVAQPHPDLPRHLLGAEGLIVRGVRS